jgi:prepilin-type N-terminal cleavage/methylation domain-containing protein
MRPCIARSKIASRNTGVAGPGFTLIEMVISLAILAVIAAALGSTLVLASRALDQDASPAAATLAARRTTDRMLAELAAATSFSERTATSVTFTMPDRDGDGIPETIRYAWSGNGGDPLTRQYNNGVPDAVAEGVQRLDLGYLLRTVEPPPPKEVESAEQILIAHDDAPGGTFKEQSIQDKNGCGAYFRPALPANALRWKVTRIEFVARRPLLATGTIQFQVTYPTAGLKPGTQVLAGATLASSSLPLTPAWQALSFGTLDNLDVTRGLCFNVKTASTSVQAIFQYEEGGAPMTPNTYWSTYNNSVGWTGPQDLTDMRIRVYGTVTTPQ